MNTIIITILIWICILIVCEMIIKRKEETWKYMVKYECRSFDDTLKKTGQPIIRLYHNGKPYLLLLDTGATHNVIDSSRLNEFDSKFMRKYATIASGIGEIDSNKRYETYKIRFDDTLNSFTDDFIAMDLSNTFDIINGERVVGILGVGFLSKYALTLDFKNNTVS